MTALLDLSTNIIRMLLMQLRSSNSIYEGKSVSKFVWWPHVQLELSALIYDEITFNVEKNLSKITVELGQSKEFPRLLSFTLHLELQL